MDKRLIFGGLLLVVILLGVGLTNTGTIFGDLSTYTGAYVQSVSTSDINGKPAVLVNVIAGVGSDQLITSVSSSTGAAWGNAPAAQITLTRTKNTLNYFLAERTVANDIYYTDPTPILACDGIDLNPLIFFGIQANPNSCNAHPYVDIGQGNFQNFRIICAQTPNTQVYTSGSDADPHYRCYQQKPYIAIADANTVGSVYAPTVVVDVASSTYHVRASLDNNHQTAPLLASDGTNFGNAYMLTVLPTFTNPPPESGILGLRYFTQPNTSYKIVANQQTTDAFNTAKSNFQTCTNNARPSGSYDLTAVQNCISKLKSDLDAAYTAPTPAAFQSASYNANTRYVSITNSFTYPSVNLKLYADKVGIVTPNAIPGAISCSITQIAGGTTGYIDAILSNTGVTGALWYSTTCTGATVEARAASGSIQVQSLASGHLSLPISGGQFGGSTSCTITASATDLSHPIIGVCLVNSTNACTNAVPPGFINNLTTCVPYCPLTLCGPNQTLINTSTTCACQGVITCPLPPAGTTCAAGQAWNTYTCSCAGTSGTNTTLPQCLPVVQSLKIDYVGGVLGVGGTPVYSCQTDLLGTVIAGAVVIFAFGAFMKKRRR